MSKFEPKIVPLFRDALPPLDEAAFKELEKAIIEDGEVRDPLVLRDCDDALVEGHHRLKIAKAHGIPYKIHRRHFKDDHDVLSFIYRNAIGRRNLSAAQEQLYRGRLYQELSANKVSGPGGNGSAAEEVAAATGVSPRTVMRDAKVAEDVAKLAIPLARAYQDGTIVLSRDQLHSLAAKDQTTQLSLARDVRTGVYSGWEAALGTKKKESGGSSPAPSAEKKTGKKGESKSDSGKKAGGKKGEKKKSDAKEVVSESSPSDPPPAPKTVKERMEEWSSAVEGLARRVVALAKELPQGEWLDANRSRIIEDTLQSAADTLRQIKAAKVCPNCEGDGCKRCRQTGWIPKNLASEV